VTKIVYNACFGGFSLSHDAVMRYGEIKGLKLYPKKDPRFSFYTYWKMPKSERPKLLEGKEWYAATIEQRAASNRAHTDATLYDRDIPRNDPALAQVVEEMGDKANGMCARLRVAEIPEGAQYRIDEYDGNESVETPSSYEWKTA